MYETATTPGKVLQLFCQAGSPDLGGLPAAAGSREGRQFPPFPGGRAHTAARARGRRESFTTLHPAQPTFITPIDPEDIHSLSSRLDDVLDAIRRRRLPMWPTAGAYPPTVVELCQVVYDCALSLEKAFEALDKDKKLLDHCIEVNRLEDYADQLVRRAVADLFQQETDPIALIKQKEIYEFLETPPTRARTLPTCCRAWWSRIANNRPVLPHVSHADPGHRDHRGLRCSSIRQGFTRCGQLGGHGGRHAGAHASPGGDVGCDVSISSPPSAMAREAKTVGEGMVSLSFVTPYVILADWPGRSPGPAHLVCSACRPALARALRWNAGAAMARSVILGRHALEPIIWSGWIKTRFSWYWPADRLVSPTSGIAVYWIFRRSTPRR